MEPYYPPSFSQTKPSEWGTKPSDWGIGMTVCIAAICDFGNAIVTASDQMITMEMAGDGMDVSGDGLVSKIRGLDNRWGVMMADNLGRASDIVDEVRRAREDSDAKMNLNEMKNCVVETYQRHARLEAVRQVLGPYAMDMETFISEGLGLFGDDGFRDLRYRLEHVHSEFGARLLVFGFDNRDQAHVFSVIPPGTANNHDLPGFWAIGAGQAAALSSLIFHAQTASTRLETAIYQVCAAKFMAESSPGVGRSTFVQVNTLEDKRGGYMINPDTIVKIRNLWDRHGKPRVPAKAIQALLGKQ